MDDMKAEEKIKPGLESLRVDDAMHPGVLTCPVDMPLRMVAKMMARYRIHCVVVFADPDEAHLEGHVWGVVSDLDLIAAADDLDNRTAGATAGTEVVTVPSDATLAEARKLMLDHQVAHLVVVNARNQRPVGVLSTLDIARVLVGGAAPPEFLVAAGMSLLI